jgi:hypothetical protein
VRFGFIYVVESGGANAARAALAREALSLDQENTESEQDSRSKMPML